jgi:hypothetical protein
MNFEKLLYWVLVLISVATLGSGIVQIVAPAFILGLISGEITGSTKQCFATIGMFMFLFGGMLLQVLLARQMLAPVFFWAGLQKIGAFVAVGIGVMNHIFSTQAMLVASFDLLSGILIFVYMRIAASPAGAPLPAVERTRP